MSAARRHHPRKLREAQCLSKAFHKLAEFMNPAADPASDPPLGFDSSSRGVGGASNPSSSYLRVSVRARARVGWWVASSRGVWVALQTLVVVPFIVIRSFRVFGRVLYGGRVLVSRSGYLVKRVQAELPHHTHDAAGTGRARSTWGTV